MSLNKNWQIQTEWTFRPIDWVNEFSRQKILLSKSFHSKFHQCLYRKHIHTSSKYFLDKLFEFINICERSNFLCLLIKWIISCWYWNDIVQLDSTDFTVNLFVCKSNIENFCLMLKREAWKSWSLNSWSTILTYRTKFHGSFVSGRKRSF